MLQYGTLSSLYHVDASMASSRGKRIERIIGLFLSRTSCSWCDCASKLTVLEWVSFVLFTEHHPNQKKRKWTYCSIYLCNDFAGFEKHELFGCKAKWCLWWYFRPEAPKNGSIFLSWWHVESEINFVGNLFKS